MVLTASQIGNYMRHTLGGDINPNLDVMALINQAGRHFVSMHPWKWLERPQAELDLRGEIAITGATWTEATRTLTKTGAFTNYSFLDGDQGAVTAGTGATEQLYKVESRTSDDAVVLKTSIGSAADGQTDIAATFELDTVALPSDLSEIVGYNATESLINSLELVSLSRLLMLKTNQIQVTAYNFYGAIIWPEMNTATPTVPFPVLKIWPAPATNDARELTIFYRAGWIDVEDDTDYIQIPVWAEALFIQIAQVWARGYEEEDIASLSQRLVEIEQSPLLMAAVRRDGAIQPDYGPTRGGAVESMPQGSNRFARATVAGPS